VGKSINEELTGPEAYQRRLPELMALSSKEVAAVNVDAFRASSLVANARDNLIGYREQLIRLYTFNIRLFDELEEYALAFYHAHLLCELASSRPTQSAAVAEAKKMRRLLLDDARALVRRKSISPSQLKDIRSHPGCLHLASDLRSLVGILRPVWEDAGRPHQTQNDLARALTLAEELLQLMQDQSTQSSKVAEAFDMKARAFTLMNRAYKEVRAGIAFLRRDVGDADKLVPSLCARRTSKKRKKQREAGVLKTDGAPETDAANSNSEPVIAKRAEVSTFGPFES